MKGVKKRVFVGLSGGVDSAVAALRLLKDGFDVVGVFIKVWQPEFLNCNWEEERLDAMRVAAHLKIPFLTCDAEKVYKQDVADYFVAEYLNGRTPNPDVMCNEKVKFGRFLEFAADYQADYVATGHYARKVEKGNYSELWRGVDTSKDQSYFLWTLTQKQLNKILFPIGTSKKGEVRAEADKAKIPVAQKKDSQGICFLGQVDIPEFLAHFVELTPGVVLDTRGQVIGEHNGALVYTLGQRHGFVVNVNKIESKPHYIVKRDLQQNTLTVSTQPSTLQPSQEVALEKVNWITSKETDREILVQTKYRQPPKPARINERVGQTTLKFLAQTELPAPGQSTVFYEQAKCLGGAIIK